MRGEIAAAILASLDLATVLASGPEPITCARMSASSFNALASATASASAATEAMRYRLTAILHAIALGTAPVTTISRHIGASNGLAASTASALAGGHDDEVAGFGRPARARHRRLDEASPGGGDVGAERLRPGRRMRAHVDDQFARDPLPEGRRAAAEHRLDGGIVGEHHYDRVARREQCARVVERLRATRRQHVARRGRAIVDRQLIAGAQQVRCHRHPHQPESAKSQSHRAALAAAARQG